VEVESSEIEALNPIGCGDFMMAGMAQGILQGLTIKEAVKKGHDYATLNALSIHPGWILENKNG
jgi:tagatose 6-phosphate kinase